MISRISYYICQQVKNNKYFCMPSMAPFTHFVLHCDSVPAFCHSQGSKTQRGAGHIVRIFCENSKKKH